MKPQKPGFFSSLLESIVHSVEESVKDVLEQSSGDKEDPEKGGDPKVWAVSSVIKNIVETLQKNGNLEVHYEVKSNKPHLDVASEQPRLMTDGTTGLTNTGGGNAEDKLHEGADEDHRPAGEAAALGLRIRGKKCLGYQGVETRIVIPEGITQIEDNAFKYRYSLEEIILPESLESIGSSAFKGCRSLKSIHIPSNVHTIEAEAFAGCLNLTSVELPEGLRHLSNNIFLGCLALKYVALPHKLTAIPEGMFAGCSSLERIRWPEDVRNLAKTAFIDCYDSDSWTGYVLENGEMIRRRIDPNDIDPEHVFYFPETPFVQSCVYNILDMIYVEYMHRPEYIQRLVSVYQNALKFCRFLTCDDPYAVAQMSEVVRNYLLTFDSKNMIDSLALESLIYMTAEIVGGSGQSYKRAEKTMFDIYKTRYQHSKNYQEAVRQSMGKALNLFGAKWSPNRYHPMIWHYTAGFGEQWDYLNFVFRIEGMLRGLNVEVTKFEPDCTEDDSLEQWLIAWSQAIAPLDLVIIDLKAPMKHEKLPEHIFSITNTAHANLIRSVLDDCHCGHLMECWSNGSTASEGLHFV